jgi:hypothetical protein
MPPTKKVSDLAAIRPGAKSGVDLSKLVPDTTIEFDPPAVKTVKSRADFDAELVKVPAGAKLAGIIKSITNVHPADELCSLREQKAKLDKRIDELRDQLLADGADLVGDEVVAVLVPSVRETLDRKAITEAFGEKAVAPFIKTTKYKTVKLEKK